MLVKTKILDPKIGKEIGDALQAMRTEMETGKLAITGAHEDIHSFVEAELESRVGEKASLIRLARSRNDTVVTDTRLHLKRTLEEITRLHTSYIQAWTSLAERFENSIIPGYTHLRRAQPILFPFYCLSHISEGMREREMLFQTLKWTDVSTLGAGAVAGTGWPIDPALTAKQLGFSSTFFNALDAVSDRDFLLAFYFAATLILTHISRWCEDFIIWSSEGLGYLVLPDELCTGSSLMPQKKNPDPLELLRGKSARCFGHLSSLFMLMKGLPSGYNRDLQEDKEPLFDAVKTLQQSLEMAARILQGVSLDSKKLAAVLIDDFSLATDVADELVRRGYSFGEAHSLAGQAVRYCEENNKRFSDLSLTEWKTLVPKLDSKIPWEFSMAKSTKLRESPGGTGEKAVARALSEAKAWLKKASS
jgi:argininosuccinate lyase